MSEFTKGKLAYTIETKRGWRIILKINGQDILHGCAQYYSEANAKELVRRWNAFEEGGIVDELVVACKVGLDAMNGLKEIAEKTGATERDIIQHKEHIKFVETAIAKAKPE